MNGVFCFCLSLRQGTQLFMLLLTAISFVQLKNGQTAAGHACDENQHDQSKDIMVALLMREWCAHRPGLAEDAWRVCKKSGFLNYFIGLFMFYFGLVGFLIVSMPRPCPKWVRALTAAMGLWAVNFCLNSAFYSSQFLGDQRPIVATLFFGLVAGFIYVLPRPAKFMSGTVARPVAQALIAFAFAIGLYAIDLTVNRIYTASFYGERSVIFEGLYFAAVGIAMAAMPASWTKSSVALSFAAGFCVVDMALATIFSTVPKEFLMARSALVDAPCCPKWDVDKGVCLGGSNTDRSWSYVAGPDVVGQGFFDGPNGDIVDELFYNLVAMIVFVWGYVTCFHLKEVVDHGGTGDERIANKSVLALIEFPQPDKFVAISWFRLSLQTGTTVMVTVNMVVALSMGALAIARRAFICSEDSILQWVETPWCTDYIRGVYAYVVCEVICLVYVGCLCLVEHNHSHMLFLGANLFQTGLLMYSLMLLFWCFHISNNYYPAYHVSYIRWDFILLFIRGFVGFWTLWLTRSLGALREAGGTGREKRRHALKLLRWHFADFERPAVTAIKKSLRPSQGSLSLSDDPDDNQGSTDDEKEVETRTPPRRSRLPAIPRADRGSNESPSIGSVPHSGRLEAATFLTPPPRVDEHLLGESPSPVPRVSTESPLDKSPFDRSPLNRPFRRHDDLEFNTSVDALDTARKRRTPR